MIATINCTLSTKHAFAPLARAYLSFAQKTPPSTHHHQFNRSHSNQAMTSAIAVMHKIASKQFQHTQNLTENQLLARSAEDSMPNLCNIPEKERSV